MNSTLAMTIKARRLVRGMDQAALASIIGCDARSIARWERGEVPSARHMSSLRAALDLTISEMDVLVLETIAGEGTQLRIEGTSVLDRLGWTYRDLLGSILDLERRTTGIDSPLHSGTVEGWSTVFEALPDSWRVLTCGTRIVGIWQLVPLTPVAYRDFRLGRLRDGEITLDHVETLDLPTASNVSLCSLAIDRSARSPRAFALLLQSLLETVCAMALRGVTLKTVCVQAWTPQIVLMCRRLDFCQIATLSDASKQIPILEADICKLLDHPALAGLISNSSRQELQSVG